MASNKNQHFVPRCYLRPFTLDGANAAINLFNIDRRRFIVGAPVKSQCSGDYFYGEDLQVEHALQGIESAYARGLVEVSSPGYELRDEHRALLRQFWLLQYLRTEAAARRSVEMTAGIAAVAGLGAGDFTMGVRVAVQEAMKVFVDEMDAVDDLKVCLLRNRTPIPFVTSDDPAVLTNRWHLEDRRTLGRSFALHSAGALFLLPLTPRILCLGYDGDVYSVPHVGGWADVNRPNDVRAFNQHQYFNCRANIFVRDPEHARIVQDDFAAVESLRPGERHRIHYAVFDRSEGGFSRYVVVDPAEAGAHERAMIHAATVHAKPNGWPSQVTWRRKGVAYSNGTGVGYLREMWARFSESEGFRKELTNRG